MIDAAGTGIVANGATLTGGISNAGTIAAAGGRGVFIGGAFNVSGSTIFRAVTIPTFTGGISNTGAITAPQVGIQIGGNATVFGTSNHATITISTFAGGIANSGTIAAAGNGIWVGGDVTVTGHFNVASVTVSTFTGGVAIDVSGANNAITINQSGGSISGAIKLSANADVLAISGGTINGNIVGAGSSDTLNFNMGSGTFTYGSAYGFTGIDQVNINSGTVILDGANNATAIDVVGGTLAGAGTLDPLTLTIHSGGTFSPGTPGVPGTSMTVTGNLAFQSGALYVVYLGSTATFANVSGTATLAGTVNANFVSGAGLAGHYTILESSGLGGTTFPGLTFTALPADFSPSLSYSADDVFLNVATMLTTGTPPLNKNQQNIATAIDTYFNNGGALPSGFINMFNLSGAPLANTLTHLDGEAATGAQKSAFQLMQDFLNLLLDPSADGQGGGAGGQVSQFAPDQDSSLPPDIALAYAHALHQKPPPSAQPQPQDFEQRWSAWASGFGGSGTTDGNASAGSNNITATDYGYAAGLTYHLTPATSYGFALAGGGTNWNLAQSLGSGRSNSFQAGVYGTTHFGPAYLSGALALANHWFTTNRIAMGDDLTANFQGQSYVARGEAGYRYAVPVTGYIIGVTPYAALQVQDFHTPSYSEADLSGGGFGLTYASMNATDTRSELGTRFDNLTVWNGMPLVLRGRLAWAHDWVSDPALGAVFQALPGSNFTVNGAAPPKNAALTTAGAELHLTANWTAMAKFDGEFGAGSQTYAGTGTVKYSW